MGSGRKRPADRSPTPTRDGGMFCLIDSTNVCDCECHDVISFGGHPIDILEEIS